ncbi:J domain-containing protein [Qipengyuania sp. JC766]|uniref:J domain-containing protein n=1 Tax=Qipengyuania sp. JC766 TaxID=3232139 RepID=UPI00345761FA
MRPSKFHGRYESEGRTCEHPACTRAGEFRAPGPQGSSFDGPGQWRWLCLDHVREFNAGYDWFEGMSADEILAAQSPASGWRTEQPAFKPTAGVDGMPRWADYDDPLDAIGARVAGIRSRAERKAAMAMATGTGNRHFSREEAEALETMGLGTDTDRQRLRRRYSELVRRYHPDRNGGDRKYEKRLGRVVEAYQLLRKSGAIG